MSNEVQCDFESRRCVCLVAAGGVLAAVGSREDAVGVDERAAARVAAVNADGGLLGELALVRVHSADDAVVHEARDAVVPRRRR